VVVDASETEIRVGESPKRVDRLIGRDAPGAYVIE
jgi:hypothetical protein